MKKTIFLILGILIVLVLGYQVFDAYIANHTYYWGTATEVGMLGSAANWKILIWSLLFAAIPVSYLLFMKKKNVKGFSIALFSGLFLYSVAAAVVKDSILGPGFLLMLFKYIILFAIVAYFIVGLLATGSWIRRKIFGSHDWNLEQIFLNIGLGLIAFCVINYVLILLHLFFGIVVALMFVGYGFCIWKMKHHMHKAKEPLQDLIDSISWEKVTRSPMFLIYVLLLLFSIMYAYHGFVLADIPYPTAWDANHAYMYFPRIWALNNGYYWEQGLAITPQIWYAYIAYWFKFMFIFGTNTWISADNLAVIMNFISGIFVLVFGLTLVKEVIHFIEGNNPVKKENVFFVVGWALLILWLTSGMGAFLVFVDNKTDLGIMALTMLALYSGFLFINQVARHESRKELMQYVLLSGIFFAGAILAKPTATFDVLNFTVLLIALWFGGLVAFGIFLFLIGVVGKSGIMTVQKFIDATLSTELLAAGGIVTLLGVVMTSLKKKWQNLRYFVIWGVVIVATLLIVKAPYLIVKQIKIDNNFSPIKLVKEIFLTKNTSTQPTEKPILLASTVDYQTLLAADVGTDTTTAPATTNDVVASCKAKNISTEDLYKNLKEPPGSAFNEDVGRYIGYGWRTFTNPWWGFMVGNGCHAVAADAKIVCENANAVEAPTLSGLQDLYAKLPENSKAKTMLGSVLEANASGTTLSLEDSLKDLKAYYQDKSWMKADGRVSMPYIMMIPFNITFNWSLQNLTSYYTDIGVVWLLCFFILILGFIYSLVQWNKKLFAVTLSALCGWALWWLAGGAILWYSLGVVIWSVIGTTLVLYTLGQSDNVIQKRLFNIILLICAIIGFYQLMLNFIRISSQGGGGPFVWYRSNVGNVTKFDANLQQKTTQKIGYNSSDVFNLQFGHYNGLIDTLDKRAEDDGVIVAGTYLPYFLKNQHGLRSDGFLVDLWKNLSDNDPCNTYLRLRDQKVGYIVIDPNIASVVQGDANSSLMDRIFGRLDSTKSRLTEYGSLTMIAKMVQEGYMSLATTNIISAKYAFLFPTETMKSLFGSTDDDLVLRAKLATLRFWPNAEAMFTKLPAIFNQRMIDGSAVGDLADVLGKTIDLPKVQGLAKDILGQKKLTPETMNALTEDEKAVLVQYLSLYNLMKTNTQQYQQVVGSVMQQSVLGNSQIMLFKLN